MDIPLFEIYWDEDDINNVSDVIRRGSHWAIGPEIDHFEKSISNYIGSKYAVSFNSGTSALHAALMAHKLGHGDEILVPSFTFIATANAALFVGAKPVFSDIEELTYGMDPEDVKERITPKTRAIMPIHYGGCPCLINALRDIAEDYNLLLIEDAAESMGAKIGNNMVGKFGDSAVFSFCQNKIISTGEGGAVTTDSNEIYERLKLIRSHGRLDSLDYFSSSRSADYVCLGYNFRMPAINAALGISQLKKIDRIIEVRRKNAEYFSKKLSNINEIILPIPPSSYYSVFQMYTIRIKGHVEVRDQLINHLSSKGIFCKVYFDPVHLTSFYKNLFGFTEGYLPVTEHISNSIISFHPHVSMTKEEIDCIYDEIASFFSFI